MITAYGLLSNHARKIRLLKWGYLFFPVHYCNPIAGNQEPNFSNTLL